MQDREKTERQKVRTQASEEITLLLEMDCKYDDFLSDL